MADGSMELKAVSYERVGRVAVVTLNRPHRNNAWTGRMHTEYRRCFAMAEADSDVRAVVVTGAGSSFCVGADSDALAKEADAGHYVPGVAPDAARPGYGARPESDHDLIWHWGLRMPVVMAVNGACAGVALALACFGDVRFVAADAKLTTASARLGLPAEFGLSWMLPRLVGVTRAADLLLSCRKFTGEEAAKWGLALEALPATEVLPAALAYADLLAEQMSPASLAATKRQIYDDIVSSDAGMAVVRSLRLTDEMMGGADFREGVAALRERRPPRFA